MGDRRTVWDIVAAVSTAGCLAGVAVAMWLARREAELERATLISEMLSLREEIRSTQAATVAGKDDVAQSCRTSGIEFMCTWTNRVDRPVSVCARGRLSRPDIENAKSRSMVACSGRLGPRETKSVSVPWAGFDPKTICFTTGRFGKELDFSVCDFKVETIDPAADQGAD